MICTGVLGNSGEQGANLFRFGQPLVRSAGVVVDRWGSIWDRAGRGTLIRCAVDGRQLAWYRMPMEEHHYSDRLAIAGDWLVILARNRLYVLSLAAEPGSEVQPLNQTADALAPKSRDGLALVGDAKELAWLDPTTGKRLPAGPGFPELMDLDIGADNTIYAVAKWQIHAIRDGRLLEDGWPRPSPGEKPQLIDGAWYSHTWHSTIRRHDLSLTPAPGVVLGGMSGSFIGHVYESPDIINGRGLARLEDGEWAVSCLEGGFCLLIWDGAKRQFSVVRRISALPVVRALGVDSQGRVTLSIGYWHWSDGPAAPLREGPGMSGGFLFQLANLGGSKFAAPGLQYGNQPRLGVGQVDRWRFVATQDNGLQIPIDTTGAAAVPAEEGFHLLAVTRSGHGYGFVLSKDGDFRRKLEALRLTTREPQPKEWTSLAVDGEGRLLAAADGAVLVFTRDGEGWKENQRWSAWGDAPAERFGKAIWIHSDSHRLWVSDRERHRVLCFSGVSGALVAYFGRMDEKGDDLAHLDSPQMLAANGNRCVVHDAGNQRLMKLMLKAVAAAKVR